LIRKILNRVKDNFKKLVKKQGSPEKLRATEDIAHQAEQPITAEKNKRKRSRKRPSYKKEHHPTEAIVPAADPTIPWDDSLFAVAKEEGKTRFHDLDLPIEIMHALYDLGFNYCTPIQAQSLPDTLSGKDATGKAQTGTGKTAAFLLTILTRQLRTAPPAKRLHGTPRALILAPTRELVLQIVEDARLLTKYMDCTIVGILGGMDYQKQQRQLTEQQVDIVVATPGRLLDFNRQKYVRLDAVETLVIDEADRMLDMGFIPDVTKIVYATPQKGQRQTLLFSATLTPQVNRLASQWTRDPVVIEIESDHVVTQTVDQQVYLVTRQEKFPLLYNIISGQKLERVMIFCNRKDETRFLAEKLQRYGIKCAILSGDIAQNKRLTTLENFRAGKITVLVATDVAGRGIHVDGVSHVINYTLPHDPEDYVHRIGRTGRAGAEGISVSFADENDSFQLPDIEEFIGEKLHCIHPEPGQLRLPPAPPKSAASTEQFLPAKKAPRKGSYPRRKSSPRPR